MMKKIRSRTDKSSNSVASLTRKRVKSTTDNRMFQDITGFKKRIICKYCGKMVDSVNFNQLICFDCGYRPHRSDKKGQTNDN